MIYCPTINCKNAWEVCLTNKEKTDVGGVFHTCECCKQDMCLGCQQPWVKKDHEKMNCHDYQKLITYIIPDEYQFQGWWNKGKNKTECPRCQSKIEKIKGCSQMRCTDCGNTFMFDGK